MKWLLSALWRLWATRNCQHPRTRPIHGDERNYAAARCLDCGKGIG